ncbi:hypothetical protein PI124_g19028 [Phytophthora idaei]|nr:hypothetical protein PI125_g19830 [Phytophthora idaei]KAG3235950.1 hypothetical protein PI124_g19028 [Phytophthora idaei]
MGRRGERNDHRACGPQWCAIRLTLERNEITYYDSMRLSNALTLRSLAHRLVPHLPQTEGRYRVDAYVSEMGTQLDSYNCGGYILLAFAMYCGAEIVGGLRKKILHFLRYHSLQMYL